VAAGGKLHHPAQHDEEPVAQSNKKINVDAGHNNDAVRPADSQNPDRRGTQHETQLTRRKEKFHRLQCMI
jgi:hypothetical protein